MKTKPFEKVKIGELFRDIDGNLLMKIPKTQGADRTYNSVALTSNKKDITRGILIAKMRDTYCEVLNKNEICDIRLEVSTTESDEAVILAEDIPRRIDETEEER